MQLYNKGQLEILYLWNLTLIKKEENEIEYTKIGKTNENTKRKKKKKTAGKLLEQLERKEVPKSWIKYY